MFMSILRVVIAFCALALLATMVFGEEMPSNNYYDPELLELERALEAEIAEDSLKQNPNSGRMEDFSHTNLSNNMLEEQPLKQPTHINLTDSPLSQPLSQTQLIDSEGNNIQQNIIYDEQTEYVTPIENEYFTDPSSLTQAEEIGTLSTAPRNLESYGVLSSDSNGFNETLWQGMQYKQAKNLLSRIQEHGIKSQSVRLLLQRALLTKATAPSGNTSQNNWLADRITTLHTLGYAEAAHLLLKDFKAEWLAEYPNMAQVWVENMLITGNPETACNFSRQHILNENSTFWRQTLLICQAIDRDVRGLQLSLDLAPEEDLKTDPLLYRLLNALLSKEETPRLKPDQVFSPLHAIMYSYYPHLMTPDALIRMPDMLLRRVVENQDLSKTTRIQAAEKLVNDFAVSEDIQALINLYSQATFTENELKNPLSAVEKIADGSMARALLWQGIKLTQLASAKSLMIKNLWERATKDGFNHISALLTPQTIHISAHPNLAWFAPLAVESHLKAGQAVQAQSWWKLIEQSRKPSRELIQAKQDLSLTLALINGHIPSNDLDTWVTNQKINTPQDAVNIQRILSTLEASNIEVPSSVWVSLHARIDDSNIEQGKGPGQLWLRVLGSSLEKGNVGETILLLAEPLMYQHPSEMMPQALANIITGLHFLTLPDDANTLALEIFLNKNKS
jgi:hypothetical protein